MKSDTTVLVAPSTWETIKQYLPMVCFILFTFIILSDAALAAEASLPFVPTMEKLSEALTGRVATAIATIGICVSGGMLIFGGQLDGFFRTMCMVVAAGSVMILAGKIVTFISQTGGGTGAH